MGWTGNVGSCNAGTTAQAYRDAVLARVNWFRSMAGVPPGISFDSVFSAKNQQAALMMSANQQLSHNPPASWTCYTADGATAAGNSNLCIGFSNDPGCLELYMDDFGANNRAVGHRRWIFYPQTQLMGTGDVAGSPSFSSANSTWVIDSHVYDPRPATRDTFVAWPPKGYVPYQVVPARWSFSYPGADFSNATVTMQRGGAGVPVALEPVENGYGENTLVWIPDNLNANLPTPHIAPSSDTPTNITINNVIVGGVSRSFSYQVVIFDPAQAGSGTPVISEVANAWNNLPPISDGAWIYIKGSNLAPTTRNWNALTEIVNGQLPKALSGVSVKINNHDAYVYYISLGQINVQAPTDGATGPVSVQVTTANGTSPAFMVTKQVTAPGIFSWAGQVPDGEKYVGALFPTSDYSGNPWVGKPGLLQSIGLPTRPAQPGETIIFFATGCGPTSPAVPAGQVVPLVAPLPVLTSQVSVRIGGIPAQAASNTGFLIFAGECQFNVTVPGNAPNGDLPIQLQIGGVSSPQNLSVTVQQ